MAQEIKLIDLLAAAEQEPTPEPKLHFQCPHLSIPKTAVVQYLNGCDNIYSELPSICIDDDGVFSCSYYPSDNGSNSPSLRDIIFCFPRTIFASI